MPKYVSDFLNYDTIKQYKMIYISAGIGSGRTYFIEQLSKQFRVLIITHRYKKEWYKLPAYNDLPEVKKYHDGLWAAKPDQIEKYYYDKYPIIGDPEIDIDILDLFDIIVIYECHRIVFLESIDNSYGFYVGKLIEEIKKDNKSCKHLICITTVPEPCKEYFFDGYKQNEALDVNLRN